MMLWALVLAADMTAGDRVEPEKKSLRRKEMVGNWKWCWCRENGERHKWQPRMKMRLRGGWRVQHSSFELMASPPIMTDLRGCSCQAEQITSCFGLVDRGGFHFSAAKCFRGGGMTITSCLLILFPSFAALGTLLYQRRVHKSAWQALNGPHLVECCHGLIGAANLHLVEEGPVVLTAFFGTRYWTLHSAPKVGRCLRCSLPSVLSTLSQASFPPRTSSTSLRFIMILSYILVRSM